MDKLTRIAIVDKDRCRPKKCRQECRKSCPVVRNGKLCIEINGQISNISEELCTGCGICTKRCPFNAIKIINLPSNLARDTTHRYGPNGFKLHRLPVPRRGEVLGLVGTNGIGKSTALKILAGKMVPNLGNHANPPEWDDLLVYFRGSELQNYFSALASGQIKAVIKPQLVGVPKGMENMLVGELIARRDERGIGDRIIEDLELTHLLDRALQYLSDGEMQRLGIAAAYAREGNIYMFDEPSSFLDIRQRIKAASTIRQLCSDEIRVIVVEHDLAVLDYLSDTICCLYGSPGAYGVVTMPYGVREGINVFLAGFIPTENMRFREDALTFKISQTGVDDIERDHTYQYEYPSFSKTCGDFQLDVESGGYSSSEIIVLMAQNGCGKTTFVKLLAGIIEANDCKLPEICVSYKPQKITPKFKGTVIDLMMKRISAAYGHPQFKSDVVGPMRIEELQDRLVSELSGGELQRVAITLALGKPADVYFIDEPSAYLDSDQRIITAKVIKRFILHAKKTAFVVEHDFIMSTYLADRVIVYSGEPGVRCTAHTPEPLVTGINRFLSSLEVTMRRDPANLRPRINKYLSVQDREQKESGNYFFID